MDRRSLLRSAALVGTGVLIGGTAAGCSHEQPEGSGAHGPASPPPATTRGGGPPEWADLAATLSGPVFVPGDAGYSSAGHLYNSIHAPAAAAVAQCRSASDVQRCLGFSRAHQVEIAARSGGHSYAGYSTCPGLVIDVSSLNDVALNPNSGATGPRTATIGAGAQLIEVYSGLATEGFVVPGGSCPTVGIAGLALGGGIGVFARAWGLTCDHVTAVNIVTADGVLRRCTPGQHEDLYWACQGGGGGNFGVVTSFDFHVLPVPPEIALFTLEWPWEAAGSVLDSWIRWVPQAPHELWANCQLYSNGSAGNGLVKVTGVFIGSPSACRSALTPLTSAVGGATTYDFVGPEEYMTAVMIEAGCQGKPVAACAAPSQSPFAAKSSYIGGPLPERSINSIVNALSALPASIPGTGGGVVFDSYGGIINQVGESETAFVHRDAVACAQYLVTYPTASPTQDTVTSASGWLDELQRAFAPVSQGAYQNYIDPSLANWQQAYYGANLARLREVKLAYDPDDAFHFAQSIPAAGR